MEINKKTVAKMLKSGEAFSKIRIGQMTLAELGNLIFILDKMDGVNSVLLRYAQQEQTKKKKQSEERKREKAERHLHKEKDRKKKLILA